MFKGVIFSRVIVLGGRGGGISPLGIGRGDCPAGYCPRTEILFSLYGMRRFNHIVCMGNKLVPVKQRFIANKICSFSLLPAPLALCFFDNDPPIVTCQNVTANSTFPNSLLELIEDFDYTYMDENPYNNTNGTRIQFNFNIGPDGDLLPPGHTSVELIARDECGNNVTCLFYAENTRKYEYLMLFSGHLYLY